MKKTLIITGLSTLLLTNVALADEINTTNATTQQTQVNTQENIQTPYYQWQGYMFDGHALLNEQVKAAIAYNNFTFDGIKVGDTYKQFKANNTITKVKGKNNQFKVENAIVTFNNKGKVNSSSKVNAIKLTYKDQTVTPETITNAFGKANIQKKTKTTQTYTYKSRTGGNYTFTFAKSKTATTPTYQLSSFTIH